MVFRSAIRSLKLRLSSPKVRLITEACMALFLEICSVRWPSCRLSFRFLASVGPDKERAVTNSDWIERPTRSGKTAKRGRGIIIFLVDRGTEQLVLPEYGDEYVL